ncbi:hypothetical protein [Helicobacter vulpis]|uniref:hypothetical protein n=1 Tax=Helicobacter vulpis TaxID=2316076 RepID=UPI000EB519C4|nr:hypothetical protein [Helicobacter vulpis]
MRVLMMGFLGLWLTMGALQGAEVLNTSLIHHTKKAKPKKKPLSKKPLPSKKRVVKSKSHSAPRVRWIYSSAFLTAYFSDGHYKQGYGLLLQNGNYLTASNLIFDQGMYAQTIMAKMQDDSAPMLICVARLHVKAIDRNRGLSLLSTHVFTNDYCQIRPESYYHARIYKKYGQNLLAHNATFHTLPLYYPQVSPKNAFEVQSLHGVSNLQENPFGRPLFNASGVFMGMLDAQKNKVRLIKRDVIMDFLRALQQRDLL